MKIRQGFVSNSSTTSFCIYGAYFENWPDTDNPEIDKECYHKEDYWWDKAREVGLEIHGVPWDDGGYIGAEWSSIRDDETGAQFKARVEAAIFKLMGIRPDKCGTHEKAWRDG